MTNTKLVMTAVICVAALEGIALLIGFNGTLLTLTIGAICALVGVAIPTPKFMK